MNNQQFQQYLDTLNRQTAEQVARDNLRTQAASVTNCDGSSPEAVRKWFSDVEIAGQVLGGGRAIIRLARRTVTGTFRKELERFVEHYRPPGWNPPMARPDPNDIPWDHLKTELTTAFLSADEIEHAKGQLETLRQAAAEDVQTFNRRFMVLADRAYPADQAGVRHADTHQTLIKYYARGLAVDEFAKKIAEHHPRIATIEEAQRLVVRLKGSHEQYQRLGRIPKTEVNYTSHEPLSLGKLQAEVAALATMVSQGDIMRNQLQVLSNAVHKQKVSFRGRPKSHDRSSSDGYSDRRSKSKSPGRARSKSPGRHRRGNRDERPSRGGSDSFKCYSCGKPGHIARHCKSKPSVNYTAGIEWS